MYRVREKRRRGIRRVKQAREFPCRKISKPLYFANWDSACSFCVLAGLRLKQISLV